MAITATNGVTYNRMLQATPVLTASGYKFQRCGYTVCLPYDLTLTATHAHVYAPTAVGTAEGVTTVTFKEEASKAMTAYTPYYIVVEGDGEVSLSKTGTVEINLPVLNTTTISGFDFKGSNVTIANSQLCADADNTSLLTAYNGSLVTAVKLNNRTLYKDGKWNTLCLPFDVTIADSPLAGDGVAVMELNGTTSGLDSEGLLTINFTEVTGGTLTAGNPYIIKWNTGTDITDPVFNDVTVTNASPAAVTFSNYFGDDGQFVGSYSPFEITDANINEIIYLGADNTLGYATAARTLRSCRAHFVVPTASTSGARAMTRAIVNFGDDETTGIRDNNRETTTNKRDDQWYTLSGQRIDKPSAKGVYIRYLNFSSAQKVVKPALDHLDRNRATASSDYTNLLIFAGCCQAHFNVEDSVVNTLFERAYQRHLDNIDKDHSKDSYRDAVVGFINIAYGWLSEKHYDLGLVWIERIGKLIDDYRQRYEDDEAYIDKQWARYHIFSAIGLEGIGQREKAADAFAAFRQTRFANTSEGQIDASDYLAMSNHWPEAADNLRDLNVLFNNEQAGYSLEDIQKYLLRKYHANVMAGRRDTASAVASQILERLDSAIIKSQWVDSEEQETIRLKEEQILQQQQRLSRGRIFALIVTIVALSVFFVIFTIVRHRNARRMADMKAAQERMESELRIARDIQMSMVPHEFPVYEGLDMYALMTPAREVGGDLYGYLMKGDWLYFCVGDVSGKGVPASLFMAQATRLFHALASQGMAPAEIATHMNDELTEVNEQAMFVTMFICRLNLKSRLLEYCNAGHNPPVLGNADGQFSFLDMESNAPIGLWPGLEYKGESIDYFKECILLLYTDGLNEAENRQQEQFGDARLLEILQSTHFHGAQQMIETLKDEVEKHRNGAEPNDDLTMMCLQLV